MTVVGRTISSIFTIYLLILIARLVVDYVMLFARDWQPRGVVLVVVEVIYTLTDPPLKLLKRFIPPLRLGQISIDLAFLVLFILVMFLIQISARF